MPGLRPTPRRIEGLLAAATRKRGAGPLSRRVVFSMLSPLLRRVFCVVAIALTARAACALDTHAQLRQYGSQLWQTESGLPQNTVHAVLQTWDGFLWIATEGGLVRFDGSQFATFTRQTVPQLPSDFIYQLMEDRHGTLWISTAGGVASYSQGSFRGYAQPAQAYATYQDRGGRVWALSPDGVYRFERGGFVLASATDLSEASRMAESPDGALWLGTEDGLLRAAAGSEELKPVQGKVGAVAALAIANGNEVWAATRMSLQRCGADGCRPVHVPGLPAHALISALVPSAGPASVSAASGSVWIGTDDGLYLLSGHAARRYRQQDGLPSDRVEQLYRDREGALWIGTSRGLARMVSGQLESLPEANPLAGNAVLSMIEDREGNLWLGLEASGLGVLRNLTFTSLTARDGLSENHVLAVVQDGRGAMWAATNGGGLDAYRGGRFRVLTTRQGLSSNIVMALASSADGTLWAGSPDGLDAIRNGHVRIYTTADGLPDDLVRSLYLDSQGTLWIGTRRGLARFADGRFSTFSTLDGLGSDFIGTIREDRQDHSLWIATLGGLSHFKNGRFQNFTTHDGLSSDIVTALDQDAHGTLWIATQGGGLDRYQAGKFTSISAARSGLPSSIYGILEDDRGYLWLSSRHGVYRVRHSDLSRFADGKLQALTVASYGASDGMGISECSSGGHPAAWRATDGTLWFATLKGLAVVDPTHMQTNKVPPRLAIEQISVDDVPDSSPLPLRIPLKISPGHNRFAFHYAGLSFTAPQRVHFRYRLEGFDRHWIDAGTQRAAYYTNLPPGHYTFRVMASNNDGIWSEGAAEAAFTVEPHVYQTLWFRALLLLAMGSLFVFAYRWRVRRVRSEFQVVLQERTRIAREIHDTLAQGFAAVSVQLEVVSRLMQTSAESARQALDTARALVRGSLQDARISIWDLRSQSAEREDLAARIRRLADTLTASSGIKTRLQVGGTYRPLSVEVESELVRIAQEAVVNAVRHGSPEIIAVQMFFAPERIELVVQDNGKGFSGTPSASQAGHFGITGMRERAERIGGTLTIASGQGEGTEVRVVVNLNGR
jgi:signal transduction histidine kinase/ligand-binding sensor domain-containing protein